MSWDEGGYVSVQVLLARLVPEHLINDFSSKKFFEADHGVSLINLVNNL